MEVDDGGESMWITLPTGILGHVSQIVFIF